jgi:hypothetical protein
MHLKTVVSGLLAVGGLIALTFVLKPPTNTEPLRLLSSNQCLECHAGVAAEWEQSHHKFAYENPEVRKLSNDFANQECTACHAPRPVLSFEPGERVLARQSERALGVDCLSCHAHPEGGVGTMNPAAQNDAPCQPRFSDRMASVDHCAACHNQHKTVEQWRVAPDELKGTGCIDCHMPNSFREGGRRGRNHSFPASHDLVALQSAVKMQVGEGSESAWVSLENVGAGHNFPTDERSRAADLQVRWANTEGGWSAWIHIHRFRDPYRDETDLTNTQLPSGERQQFALPLLDGMASSEGQRAEVRLLYRTNPYLPDEEAKELERLVWGS